MIWQWTAIAAPGVHRAQRGAWRLLAQVFPLEVRWQVQICVLHFGELRPKYLVASGASDFHADATHADIAIALQTAMTGGRRPAVGRPHHRNHHRRKRGRMTVHLQHHSIDTKTECGHLVCPVNGNAKTLATPDAPATCKNCLNVRADREAARAAPTAPKAIETIDIALTQLVPNPNNPRRQNSAHIADMAKTLKIGQVQSIVVRRVDGGATRGACDIARALAAHMADLDQSSVFADLLSIARSVVTLSPLDLKDATQDALAILMDRGMVIDADAAAGNPHVWFEATPAACAAPGPFFPAYEIICGHQRRLAAIEAGLNTLRADVRDVDDSKAMYLALVENSSRTTVDPLAEADAIAQLVAQGQDVDELGDILGHGPQWMRDRLALQNVAPAVRELYENGQLWMKGAIELSTVSHERQAQIVESIKGGYNYDPERRIQHHIIKNELINKSLSRACWDLDDTTLGAPDEAATEGTACTGCRLRSDIHVALFDEQPASCLDRACWDRKETEFLKRMDAEGRAKTGNVHSFATLIERKPYYIDDAVWVSLTAECPPIFIKNNYDVDIAYSREALATKARELGHDKAADVINPRKAKKAEKPKKPPRPKRAQVDAAQRQMVAAHTSGEVDYEAALKLIVPVIVDGWNCNPRKAIAKRRMIESGMVVSEDVASYSPAELLGVLIDLAMQSSLESAIGEWSVGLAADSAWVRMLEAKGIEVPEHAVRR